MICLFVILIYLLFKLSSVHGCPSGPRGYVKAVMCSHSRVRVPLRAFSFPFKLCRRGHLGKVDLIQVFLYIG